MLTIPHYLFLLQETLYDFYVFLEYDALYTGSFADLVDRLAALDVDFAALSMQGNKENWFWTSPHLQTYSFAKLEGCLISVSCFSRRALNLLFQQRLQMQRSGLVPYWPIAEVFLPTEARRLGLRFVSLESLGNVDRMVWRPPTLEAVALEAAPDAFVHPVYDQPRYIQWALDQGTDVRSYLDPRLPALQALSPLPAREYFARLARRAGGSLRAYLLRSLRVTKAQ